MSVHIDRGGTFTDVVHITSDGRVHVAKVPSDEAVVGALVPRGEALTFGTTVATNALLERRGVATLLVVAAGFEDLVHLRDMARPALFDPDRAHPPTLATHVVSADALAELLTTPGDDALARFEAVAVVLLGGGDDPRAELALEAALRAKAPGLYVALGHRVSRELGYLARVETTLVDAAITPILGRALARDRIPDGALAMRSDGTLVAAPELRAHEAVLSGPAGGVLATLAVAEAGGFRRAIGLDMGGTSTDVCLVDTAAGATLREGDLEVAGVRLRRAMLEIETIAAGGGSILSAGPLGLAVGPASAGADPGPQCYGRGGPPTLTDAALALGLVDARAFPRPLDAAMVALPGPPDAARAFVAIAREAMAQAVRRLAMQRGVDLAAHALVAYGGAGGQHAAAVAELLGVDTVLVHPAAAVFCAYGQCLARRSEARARTLLGPLAARVADLEGVYAALAAELPHAPDDVHGTGWLEPERALLVGHAGTDHPIEVPAPRGATYATIAAAFERAHVARYGFSRALPLDVFGVILRVHARAHEAPRCDDDPFALGSRTVHGPAVLHATTTSVEVPAGWSAATRDGLLRLERRAHATTTAARGEARELWQNRLAAIASEAGVVLARLARSVSIRERLDFSCAVFDRDGRLVTNAPHIPVHLGAMGETVRDVAAHLDAARAAEEARGAHGEARGSVDGDAWLSNDPRAGGSHLPDLTVVSLVEHGAERFFVASRGHHVDVGGIAAGSMPLASRTLADEGVCFSRVPLVTRGVLTDLRARAAGSRQPDVVAADLEAQLAANAHMARRLRELDAGALAAAMRDICAHAEAGTARLVAALVPAGAPAAEGDAAAPAPRTARDTIDGVPLQVTIVREPTREGERLVFDFAGTGGPHAGNLNAPSAVVRASILYALRVALADPLLPLNDGTLAPVVIRAPRPSIVAPPPEAAVVGGNVETSQRLVDLVFAALGLRAGSAGTMNNLVIARAPDDPDPREWVLYETLGGGFGATPSGPGASARQLHMTNTRATDPEVLAARLPLVVRRFAIRRGSGGQGRHVGGDGLVRELEVTRPAVASLLAAWRPDGAPGLEGGGRGAPGRAFVVRAGTTTPWHGEMIHLATGDRVIVETPGGGAWGARRS